ncbi:MAG TPA: hypothetical protein VG815_01550, partial [Chloroflexota bacterium]|nr:hypothetical protein [Chloroflexota bacterium]
MNDSSTDSPITGADLLEIGWKPGPLFGRALALGRELGAGGVDPSAVLDTLRACWSDPESFSRD